MHKNCHSWGTRTYKQERIKQLYTVPFNEYYMDNSANKNKMRLEKGETIRKEFINMIKLEMWLTG